MLKTWKFWKTFFTTYFALVAGIWGFVQIYSFFREDSLKQLFDANWLIIFYIIPLFIAFSVATLTNKEENQAETLDQRNRRVMLDHVENFWVKGILEKSLHGVALLELGIKEESNAVNYPWEIKKASTNETLPEGKSMSEIFKEIGLGRSLLILGTPGSGKTTMLLELTRQLIDLARKDENEPIPVVFNLSSWTDKLALVDWLAEQLNIFYYVPKKTAQKLVTDNKMFLLLDGLDEVKEDLREKCVSAINEFKNEHGLTSLVICSRIEEYQAVQTKLALAGAITLQPLTSKQVDTYFDKFDKSLASLKQILKKDKVLQELTETPLMLSIMVLAYKDVNIKEIPELKNSKEQRKHLFDTYINRMFEHLTRSEKKDFSKEKTLHYLSWLAYQMVKHNLITYQIETMQPSWLKEHKQIRMYKWIVSLICVLIGVLIFWLSFGLRLELSARVFGMMSFGLLWGVIGVLSLGLSEEIRMVDKLNLTWKRAQTRDMSLLIVLLIGLPIGLVFGMLIGPMVGLILGLLTVLVFVLLQGLIGGLNVEQIQETNYPGQRLKQTLYNAIIVGIFGLTFGLSFGLIFSLGLGLGYGMNFGLGFGLSFGLGFGLFFGILGLIQHHILRLLLTKDKILPKRLISFLNYAVDLIFLRRVGGSYIFVHRLLMEHFAEMYVEKENT